MFCWTRWSRTILLYRWANASAFSCNAISASLSTSLVPGTTYTQSGSAIHRSLSIPGTLTVNPAIPRNRICPLRITSFARASGSLLSRDFTPSISTRGPRKFRSAAAAPEQPSAMDDARTRTRTQFMVNCCLRFFSGTLSGPVHPIPS